MRNILAIMRCERGVAYVEFALSITVLLLMFLGSIEVTRFVLILQKLEKTVDTVADVTTQADPKTTPLSASTMSQLMSAVDDMMAPYPFGSSGRIIVSDITKASGSNPVIKWQYCANNGTLSATSHIGTSNGATATLPSGFTMNDGEEVVIAEIFYKYAPITGIRLQTVMTASTLYKTAVYLPRLGALSTFSSTCP